jgi:hypothetical protein
MYSLESCNNSFTLPVFAIRASANFFVPVTKSISSLVPAVVPGTKAPSNTFKFNAA